MFGNEEDKFSTNITEFLSDNYYVENLVQDLLPITRSYSTNFLEKYFRGKRCQDARHHCANGPIGDGVTIHRHLNLDNHDVNMTTLSLDTDLVTIQILECEHSALSWKDALDHWFINHNESALLLTWMILAPS